MRFITPIKSTWYWLERVLQSRKIQAGFITGILIITLICLLQPEYDLLKRISRQTVLILLLWLTGGVAFLMLKVPRLAFVSLFSCAALCLYLKNASKATLGSPMPLLNEDVKFSIGHFNLSSIQDELEEDLMLIKNLNRDILIFQEFTPQFRHRLLDFFDTIYQERLEYVQMDDFGQIIFSKFPVLEKDTLNVMGMPVLHMEVQINDGSPLHIIAQYNLPALTDQIRNLNRQAFDQLTHYIRSLDAPLALIGTLNYVSWDNDLVRFKDNARLTDSRKSFFPSFGNGSRSIFSAPVEHILFNDKIECPQFKKVENKVDATIGIRGEYQLRPGRNLEVVGDSDLL